MPQLDIPSEEVETEAEHSHSEILQSGRSTFSEVQCINHCVSEDEAHATVDIQSEEIETGEFGTGEVETETESNESESGSSKFTILIVNPIH